MNNSNSLHESSCLHTVCQTPAELRIAEAEGTPAGALFQAINSIASAVEGEFPSVAVDTIAGGPAPAITRPRGNVIVRLTDIDANFAKPLTDRSNAPAQRHLESWAKTCDRIYIWHYITSFSNYTMPFPDWSPLGVDTANWASHGVRGVFTQAGASPAGAGPAAVDMDALKAFVVGRMLWNSSLDPDALTAQFLAGYYGEAAASVRTYMETMSRSVDAAGYYLREFGTPASAPFLTPHALLASARALEDGRQVVTGKQRARVEVVRQSVYYIALQRWDELRGFAQNRSIEWPLAATKAEAWTEFSRVWNSSGTRSVSQGLCGLACFREQVFPPRAGGHP